MRSSAVISDVKFSQQIVNRILKGDMSAETEMVQRFQGRLYSSVYRVAWDKHVTEDIVQDTWVIALENIRASKLRDAKQLGSYIFRIGAYQLVMKYRADGKFNFGPEEETARLQDTDPGPDIILENTQFYRTVIVLMGKLRVKRDRELIGRFYLLEESKRDLCHDLNLSPEHFDRVIYRARERFKLLWSKTAPNISAL